MCCVGGSRLTFRPYPLEDRVRVELTWAGTLCMDVDCSRRLFSLSLLPANLSLTVLPLLDWATPGYSPGGRTCTPNRTLLNLSLRLSLGLYPPPRGNGLCGNRTLQPWQQLVATRAGYQEYYRPYITLYSSEPCYL